MSKINIDTLDKRILSELSEDCRQDYSALAQKLQFRRDKVKYRVNKLERLGVISKYYTLINPYKFGLCLYKCLFRLENHEEKLQKLLRYLEKHPRTFWMAECNGQWDLIYVAFARSPKEFQDQLDAMFIKFSDIVLSFSIYTITEGWYYSRGYLSGFSTDRLFIGGEQEYHKVTELDFKIIQRLANNGRLPHSHLAAEIKCAPATIRYRLDRMNDLGIIATCRAELDTSKIGRDFFKAQVHVSKHDPRREDEFRAYCKMNPNILNLIKQIGDCRLELEIEAQGIAEYNQLLNDIRKSFRGFIRSIDTTMITGQRFIGVPRDITELN